MNQKITLGTKIHHFFCRPQNYDWYLKLSKPIIVPPAELVSLVWTILYTMNALSLYFYLNANNYSFDDGVLYFCTQIFGNSIYCYLFFKLKMTVAALADCILIIAFTSLTIIKFHQKDQFAAQLLYPYLAWLFIALYINIHIVVKNR